MRSAKNLIDFSNIGYDTERVERVNQNPKSPGGGVEEEIVFDMHRSNSSSSYKNSGTFKRSSS